MITNDGKRHIKRYLAGQVPSIARSISFGIGEASESLTDVELAFEIDRSEIKVVSYDFTNNKLIFKAPVPSNFSGSIYEIGIYSQLDNEFSRGFGSKIITSFDSQSETWLTAGSPALFGSTSTRVGADSLVLSPAASATATSILSDLSLDLSGYSASDAFKLAFNVGSSNTASVFVRFRTDASNYYTITRTSPPSGYNFYSAIKGSATVTGNPFWSNITSIEVGAVSTAGGSGAVAFDALRIEDVDTVNTDYVLVARKKLAAPVLKEVGRTQDIEFTLDITV